MNNASATEMKHACDDALKRVSLHYFVFEFIQTRAVAACTVTFSSLFYMSGRGQEVDIGADFLAAGDPLPRKAPAVGVGALGEGYSARVHTFLTRARATLPFFPVISPIKRLVIPYEAV